MTGEKNAILADLKVSFMVVYDEVRAASVPR
jgi:hypothetical protein